MYAMKSYDTVSEAVGDLIKRGYIKDFNIVEDSDCLICSSSGATLSSNEFEIDEVYRFEGESDPGDEMILFALSGKNFNIKGILLNAYGVYAEAKTSQIVSQLHNHLL